MPKFQVLAGKHYEPGDPEPYTKGYVVESDRDLDKMFANKFLRIGEPLVPAQMTRRSKAPGKASQAPSAAQADQDVLPNNMTDRTVINDGVYDNYQEHQQILAGKKRAPTMKTVVAGTLSSQDVTGAAEDQEQQERQAQTKEQADLGEDVSEQFAGAADAGLIVYKEKANKYHVAHEDNPSEPLSKKAGLKKSEVKPFIKKQAKAAEDEESAPEE